ncbi:hypothetical protein TNCT1_42810 [Streptomyces sp. 1-11]|nr:hypothetical protein TNCT1_42810 [Streptomyces sp. 1-11]
MVDAVFTASLDRCTPPSPRSAVAVVSAEYGPGPRGGGDFAARGHDERGRCQERMHRMVCFGNL